MRPIRKPLSITGPDPVIENGSSYQGQLRRCVPTFVPEERNRSRLRNALFRSKYYMMDNVQKPELPRCLFADFCVTCVYCGLTIIYIQIHTTDKTLFCRRKERSVKIYFTNFTHRGDTEYTVTIKQVCQTQNRWRAKSKIQFDNLGCNIPLSHSLVISHP